MFFLFFMLFGVGMLILIKLMIEDTDSPRNLFLWSLSMLSIFLMLARCSHYLHTSQ